MYSGNDFNAKFNDLWDKNIPGKTNEDMSYYKRIIEL